MSHMGQRLFPKLPGLDIGTLHNTSEQHILSQSSRDPNTSTRNWAEYYYITYVGSRRMLRLSREVEVWKIKLEKKKNVILI